LISLPLLNLNPAQKVVHGTTSLITYVNKCFLRGSG